MWTALPPSNRPSESSSMGLFLGMASHVVIASIDGIQILEGKHSTKS
jgi:hypothetical protein